MVFLEAGPMATKVEGLGARATIIEAGRVRQVGHLASTARKLGNVLRASRADVVVSWMSKAHLYAAPTAAVLRLPSLWFQHGLPSRTDPIDRAVTMLPADAVLAPSRTVAAAQHALWPHRPTRVAYPGIDVEGMTADARNAEPPLSTLGIPPDAPVLGLVARLQSWKGIHVFVAALPQVLRAHPEAHAVVVGGDHPLEPGYRLELEQLAARLGVGDRVHLTGYRPDARSWMRAFDVVIHASDNEPFGLVVLEAMALGKPLIAGAVGGPTELIRDGTEGFLVPFGDDAAMASRISQLLADPGLGRRMGAAALERARAFSPARFAGDVLATLSLVTEARRVR